jgi:Putative periplasmic protein kinase ArgK and related GTPases of G3E family
MVDCFLFLTLARTATSSRAVKKGVLELVDVVAVNKADGPHEPEARRAARELSRALRLLQPVSPSWTPPVLTCSGLEGTGLDAVWEQVLAHRAALEETGELAERRSRQQVDWMWSQVKDRLLENLRTAPGVRALAPRLEEEVRSGTTTATLAAEQILSAFTESPQSD